MLTAFTFLTSASYVLTSAIGVSLYLSRVGASALPVVLAASAVAVVIVSSLTYATIQSATIKKRLIACWSILLAASIALSILIQTSNHSVYWLGLLYVLGEVRGCLNTVFLTSLSTDYFAQSDSKRPYALVAAGAPAAGILTGLLLGYEASAIGDIGFLRMIALLDLAVLMVVPLLPKPRLSDADSEQQVEQEAKPESAESKIRHEQLSRFRMHLTSLLVIKTAVLTLIGFQWKFAVSQYLHENETAMIAYFAAFYAITDVLILLSQLLVAGRLLDRFGIGIALIGYPCIMSVIGVIALSTEAIWPWFILMTLARGMDVYRRSMHDPALSAAFALFRQDVRRRMIVLIKGVFKPIAEVIAALVLLLFADGSGFDQFTIFWLLLLVPWLVSATRVSRTYRLAN